MIAKTILRVLNNIHPPNLLKEQTEVSLPFSRMAPDCGISLYLKINILGLILIELSR